MEWVNRQSAEEPTAARLAAAGTAALGAAMGLPGDRSVALDLLAADALVTLALLYQAEHEPTHLAAFARQVRGAGAATG